MMHAVIVKRPSRRLACAALAAASLSLLAGCGDSKPLTDPGPVPEAVTAAGKVDLKDFPTAAGQTLTALSNSTAAQLNFGQANGTFVPGSNRVAFALIGTDGKPVYAPTVVYVSQSENGPVRGPFAAPADPMVPQAAYMSKTAAADTGDLKAVYETNVPLPKAGKWKLLTLSKTKEGLAGSATAIDVAPSTAIPGVGDRPPAVTTDTLTAGKGNLAEIDTRDPHAPTLHQYDFKKVVGTKPVALLFATPQLCQSRICGPVTDLLLQLQANYGDRVDAIQQEVYVGNKIEVKDGVPCCLRPQLRAFNLESEPWFFTVGKDGLIKARLEGAMGLNAMNRAIEAAVSG